MLRPSISTLSMIFPLAVLALAAGYRQAMARVAQSITAIIERVMGWSFG
jgi:hypothetical protein